MGVGSENKQFKELNKFFFVKEIEAVTELQM